ncbi:hypothetical protein N2152v2_007776 [Parachlorella kessleri]
MYLQGDEGAGKSAFSRAFIRAALQNPDLDVPLPSQSLHPNEYEDQRGLPILHFDLNDLQQPGEEERQGLIDTFPQVVSLIEWAEQLRQWGAAPEQRLAIYFRRLPAQAFGGGQQDGSYMDAHARLVTVVPHTGSWELRAGYLHANLARSGASAGLVVLSDEMAASWTAGLPESLLPNLVRA